MKENYQRWIDIFKTFRATDEEAEFLVKVMTNNNLSQTIEDLREFRYEK